MDLLSLSVTPLALALVRVVFLYISAKYENVVMYGDTAPDSSECLANLNYSCAVGGPEGKLFYSVQSFLGLEIRSC